MRRFFSLVAYCAQLFKTFGNHWFSETRCVSLFYIILRWIQFFYQAVWGQGKRIASVGRRLYIYLAPYSLSAPYTNRVRSIGTAALNMMNVAKGCSEAYYEFGVHCWDYCAASVVVTEAGGVCVDTTGCYLCFYWVKY